MSLSNENNINYCVDWKDACSSFADLNYQSRCWFQLIGPEVSSYDEDFSYLMSWAETLEANHQYLNQESYQLIKAFIEQLLIFSDEFDSCFDEEILENPDWLKVVKSAQRAVEALEQYEKELKNG